MLIGLDCDTPLSVVDKSILRLVKLGTLFPSSITGFHLNKQTENESKLKTGKNYENVPLHIQSLAG